MCMTCPRDGLMGTDSTPSPCDFAGPSWPQPPNSIFTRGCGYNFHPILESDVQNPQKWDIYQTLLAHLKLYSAIGFYNHNNLAASWGARSCWRVDDTGQSHWSIWWDLATRVSTHLHALEASDMPHPDCCYLATFKPFPASHLRVHRPQVARKGITMLTPSMAVGMSISYRLYL